ncbi:MAG: hypothetical protein Q8P61_03215 [Candidatus Nanopelagicales bacterium]|nr:hypothetical protein [Candidatus Nanopelagicales bacterium]
MPVEVPSWVEFGELEARVAALESQPEPEPVPEPEPEPEPGPEPGLLVNALQNPSASGWPDATNTGVPAGTTLIPSPDLRVLDTSLRENGVTVANRPTSGSLVRGPVTLYPDRTLIDRAATARIQQSSKWPLHITRSRVRRPDGVVTSAVYPIDTRDTRENAMTFVYDCEIYGGMNDSAICQSFIDVRRCDISGGEDHIRFGHQVIYRDNYLHDPERFEGGHVDSFQSGGASNAEVVHNTILCATRVPDGQGVEFGDGWWDPYNAVLMIGNNAGPISGVLFEDNLVDGGNFTFNANWSTSHPHTGLVIRKNRFGRHFRYGPRSGDLGAEVWEGNVWDDTNEPV